MSSLVSWRVWNDPKVEWNWRFNVLAFLTVPLWPLVMLSGRQR